VKSFPFKFKWQARKAKAPEGGGMATVGGVAIWGAAAAEN